MLLVLLGLALIESSFGNQRERLSRHISQYRQNIEPLTNIRRDARKTYVALLERWLAPAEDWPRLGKVIAFQAAALARSSQDFLYKAGLAKDEQDHRAALGVALADWATFIGRVVGGAPESDFHAEAHQRLGVVDRECSAILKANVDSATYAEATLEDVRRKSATTHVIVVSLRVIFIVLIVLWYLRMRAGRRAAEVLRQQHQQHEQNLALECKVGARTSELSAAKHELEKRVHELATAKNQLVQAEKLQAVGQLAAGIAHEINTPTQFVGDSLHFLKEAVLGYQRLIVQYRRVVDALAREASGPGQVLVGELRRIEEDVDLPYLDSNVPSSFVTCMDGIFRITTIVEAMKEFAQPDQREKSPADLNQALQTTLVVARSDYAGVAEIATEFSELPPVACYVGDLNQVFLNLIINAAHAIRDLVGQGGTKGTIRIRTSREDDYVRIDVADTGPGIPEAIRHRVFEPFFTTKEVGKGTGQGLAIARSVVVTKHGGSLTFESEVGKGTTFTIRLPIGISQGLPSEMQSAI